MAAQRRGHRPRRGGARDLHVEGYPHDLVVDERALRAQTVGAAHVAVVGGEDDHRVVPPTGSFEGGEHDAQVAVGQLVEMDVVVEVAQPRPLVGRVDVPPQPVLLVPAPLPMGFGLGVEVVVEVGRQAVDHLGVGLGEDGEGVVVLPGGRLEHRPDGGYVVGVPLAVAGLVHREPHHVMRVDQGHGEEPGIGAAGAVLPGTGAAGSGSSGRFGILLQPVGGVGGDERVEVHAGPGPTHEMAVVAVPVGEAVGLHVRCGGVGQVPLPDVRGAVAAGGQQRAEGGCRGRQLGVLGHDHVVQHPVALEVATGEQAGPAGRARRGMGEVVGELEALGPEPVPPRQRDAGREPGSLALLIGDHEEDVGAPGVVGHGVPR